MEDATIADEMSKFVTETMIEATELWDISDEARDKFIRKTQNYVYDMFTLTQGDGEITAKQLLKCVESLGILSFQMKKSLSFLDSENDIIMFPKKGGTH